MKKLILSFSLLSLMSWPAAAARAQEAPTLLARIERALAEKEPRWKVVSTTPHEIHLKSGGSRALVRVLAPGSAEAAGEAFKGHTVAFGGGPGRRGKKVTLPDFADENLMWHGFGPAGTTSIHFRQGGVYVNLIAPSRAAAERLARLALVQVIEHQKAEAGGGARP